MERPAFVPLVRGLAARVGGVKAEAYTQDPTAWASLLIKTAELFNLDGVVAGLDFTLLAEACGCPVRWRDDRPAIAGPAPQLCSEPEQAGRLKVALEKARQVFEVTRSNRACVAALTGPVSLARQVFGPEEGLARLAEIKPLAVRVTEAFCATRPDVLIFLEGRALAQGEIGMPQRKIYNTLRNLAAHYDIPVGMFLRNYADDLPSGLEKLKIDFHVLGLSQDGGLPPRKKPGASGRGRPGHGHRAAHGQPGGGQGNDGIGDRFVSGALRAGLFLHQPGPRHPRSEFGHCASVGKGNFPGSPLSLGSTRIFHEGWVAIGNESVFTGTL